MASWTAIAAPLIPHGYCLSWQPGLMAMHIGADFVIAGAYASIPVFLLKLVRGRHDLQFPWVFVLFGAFILACGASHVMSLWTMWSPDYLASGVVKMVTAVVSVATALALVPLIPKAIALPGPAQWEAVHRDLRLQVAERSRAEAEVRARTVELEAANHQLEEDLAERRRTAAQLQLAACVFDNALDGIVVTDANSCILSVNPAFTTLTGYSADEAIGRKLSMLRSDRNGQDFYRTQWGVLLEQGQWKGEFWNRRKDGELFCQWINLCAVHGADGQPTRYVGVFNDVTALRRQDEYIRHLAFHDALTGLPNRSLFMDRLTHAIECAHREQTELAVMFIDLDRFKQVNDTLGHDVGDDLLKTVANRLRARLRESDTAARLGGDEFVVLLENLPDPMALENLAIEIIQSLSSPLVINGHMVQIGASIGVAAYPLHGISTTELLQRADVAMYSAKSAGAGQHRFWQGTALA